MMSSGGWDGQDHHMGGASDDDFGHFLDMSNIGDGMQFDFNSFQNGSDNQTLMASQDHANPMMHPGHAHAHAHSHSHSHSTDSMTLTTTSTPQTATPTTTVPSQMMPISAPNTDPISTIDAQIQYLQQQKFLQQQRQLQEQRNAYFTTQNHSVPPTPQSLEMPPGSGHFYSHPDHLPQAHDLYDSSSLHQRPLKERHDMAFTPLVSPAVTPLDPHFSVENAFAMPGAYFSPLTSPALHAQNDSNSVYDASTHSDNSPVAMDLEPAAAAAAAAAAATLELSKKARKNSAAKSRSKGVRSSPITKPQRRKAGPSPAIVSHVLSEVDETGSHGQLPPGAENDSTMLPLPAASMLTDGSEENASVSPENLTDMPPPPVPSRKPSNSRKGTGSAGKSPYMRPQGAANAHVTSDPSTSEPWSTPPAQAHPATPASIMRLPASRSKKAAVGQHEQTATDSIESLELPESHFKSASSTPTPRESPRIVPSTERTSTAPPTRQKPPPSPAATPRRSGTASASQSPMIQPGGPSGARRTPQLGPQVAPHTGRKRSTGSAHASPALLPRISPSIKPLLPGGDSKMPEASHQLLMSKSNYQNILEGNQVPGVTYPSELSSHLTSKRTSHKIAEQGRRNRINSALQDLHDVNDQPQTLHERVDGYAKHAVRGGTVVCSEDNVVLGRSRDPSRSRNPTSAPALTLILILSLSLSLSLSLDRTGCCPSTDRQDPVHER
ncbi:Helix-loop-helix DNA-binding domain [Geosmithia morbida]|uniref:Helix-loop-helix DNA-binding domain n=1 Tax=Geosmithia morbida TaxID=1094350 RepID=A0A9P4YY57_9HYPO|nr:Helix-loop-helix DNA-binding domain [Geosmithia morbida]KAF4123952.1 Helix-loop-helix DNA-binding domain [Geosmithia morbida]